MTRRSKEIPPGRFPDYPPPRLDKKARAHWARVPESVRREITRLIEESEAELIATKADALEWEKLKPYAEMAEASGTDLATALELFTNIDQLLRRDLLTGLDVVCQQSGIRTQDGSPIRFIDVARYILAERPEMREH